MFSSHVKIRIEKQLYERLAQRAKEGGYSSTEEFVTHVLERQAGLLGLDANTEAEVEKQLRGLGYIE